MYSTSRFESPLDPSGDPCYHAVRVRGWGWYCLWNGCYTGFACANSLWRVGEMECEMKDRVETVRKILTGLGVVVSGIGLATAFPPFDQTINSWSCLVPLLWIIRSAPRKRAVWSAFFTGILFWLVSLCWLPAIIKNGGPWALVVLGMVGLSAACSAYWALFAWLSSTFWQQAKAKPFLRVVCVLLVDPILWAGTEYLRGTLFSGFAWNFLGVSQVHNIPFIQVSSLFGVYAVSAMLVLVNGAVTSICQRLVVPFWNKLSLSEYGIESAVRLPFPVRLGQSLESILPFLLVFGVWFWGNARIHGTQPDGIDESVRVAVIQPNIPCVFSCTPEQMRLMQIERVLDQTKMAGLAKPDLIVWPESAVPGMVPVHNYSMEFLRLGAVASQGTVLAGVSEMRGKNEEENLYYNSAWLVSPEGKECGIYRKQHLVPFGEYIPFDKAIPWLQRLVPIGVSCTPGDSASVLTLPAKSDVKIGALICFEDTVPPLSRAAVKNGATVLALLTNDAWFNQSCEPLQHQMQAVFRSVENQVPMVRSANSGVSCFVDKFGRVKRLELEGKIADFHGFLLGVTEPNGGGTFYTRAGDLPLVCAFSVFALLAFVLSFRHSGHPIRPKEEKLSEKERRWRMLHPDRPPMPTPSSKPSTGTTPIAAGMMVNGRLVRDAGERYARVEVDGIPDYRFRVDWSDVMSQIGFENPLQGKEVIEQVLPFFFDKDYKFRVTDVDSALYRATLVCPDLNHEISDACAGCIANRSKYQMSRPDIDSKPRKCGESPFTSEQLNRERREWRHQGGVDVTRKIVPSAGKVSSVIPPNNPSAEKTVNGKSGVPSSTVPPATLAKKQPSTTAKKTAKPTNKKNKKPMSKAPSATPADSPTPVAKSPAVTQKKDHSHVEEVAKPAQKSGMIPDCLILDGANIILLDRELSWRALKALIRELDQREIHWELYCDASIKYVLLNKQPEGWEYLMSLKNSGKCNIVPADIAADEFILMSAHRVGAHILSNDLFRQYADDYPWVVANKQAKGRRVHRFTVANRRLLIPDLKIDIPIS